MSATNVIVRNFERLNTRGLPASERTRIVRIEYKCCRPKSRIWVHHRRNSFSNDVIVDKYPTPISVTCEHLKMWIELVRAVQYYKKNNNKKNNLFQTQLYHQSTDTQSACVLILVTRNKFVIHLKGLF